MTPYIDCEYGRQQYCVRECCKISRVYDNHTGSFLLYLAYHAVMPFSLDQVGS